MELNDATGDPWGLAAKAVRGDKQAEELLWQTFRPRLRRMVAAELDPRVSQRVDPSDVVQETILEAHGRLPACVTKPPLPFYPWLRGIATERLFKVHRAHPGTQSRDAAREVPLAAMLPDDSVDHLARRLMSEESSPVHRVLFDELRRRVRETLNQLPEDDRRVAVKILRLAALLDERQVARFRNEARAAASRVRRSAR
jgi:RNA polymerase sigma-70 factor (ECF subfamily)